jgi:hypothetical protein
MSTNGPPTDQCAVQRGIDVQVGSDVGDGGVTAFRDENAQLILGDIKQLEE